MLHRGFSNSQSFGGPNSRKEGDGPEPRIARSREPRPRERADIKRRWSGNEMSCSLGRLVHSSSWPVRRVFDLARRPEMPNIELTPKARLHVRTRGAA